MRGTLVTLGVGVLSLTGLAAPSAAAPITSYYQVSVTEKFDYAAGTTTTLATPITFLMSLTFDDQVTRYTPGTGEAYTSFGTPTFDGLPDFGDVDGPNDTDNSETRAYRTTGTTPDYSEALAYSGAFQSSADSQSQKYTYLLGTHSRDIAGPNPLGQLDAATFLQILNATSMTFNHTSYFFSFEKGYLPGSAQWTGTATRVDPVPEPGTLALVGSGLAAAFLRARRRRNT
jgi:hypothetical protein